MKEDINNKAWKWQQTRFQNTDPKQFPRSVSYALLLSLHYNLYDLKYTIHMRFHECLKIFRRKIVPTIISLSIVCLLKTPILLCTIYRCVLLIKRLLRLVGRWARKPVNHTSWVAVVTPTDRPKSVRNRCLIELFCGVVCVVTLPFWHFCWCRGFCHRTESDLFLFLMAQSVVLLLRKRNVPVSLCQQKIILKKVTISPTF